MRKIRSYPDLGPESSVERQGDQSKTKIKSKNWEGTGERLKG